MRLERKKLTAVIAALVLGGVYGAAVVAQDAAGGYRDIAVTTVGDAAVIDFEFYNGAMGTEQCERLCAAYADCLARGPRVIVLAGGRDFWSNADALRRLL